MPLLHWYYYWLRHYCHYAISHYRHHWYITLLIDADYAITPYIIIDYFISFRHYQIIFSLISLALLIHYCITIMIILLPLILLIFIIDDISLRWLLIIDYFILLIIDYWYWYFRHYFITPLRHYAIDYAAIITPLLIIDIISPLRLHW
jgi:hypothetical protein